MAGSQILFGSIQQLFESIETGENFFHLNETEEECRSFSEMDSPKKYLWHKIVDAHVNSAKNANFAENVDMLFICSCPIYIMCVCACFFFISTSRKTPVESETDCSEEEKLSHM